VNSEPERSGLLIKVPAFLNDEGFWLSEAPCFSFFPVPNKQKGKREWLKLRLLLKEQSL
jgi:hypothetical protein